MDCWAVTIESGCAIAQRGTPHIDLNSARDAERSFGNLRELRATPGCWLASGVSQGASGLSRSQAKGTTMLSKHKVGTPMSGLLAVTRRFGRWPSCSSGSRLTPRLQLSPSGSRLAYAQLAIVQPRSQCRCPILACLRSRWAPGSAPSCWPVAACCCWPTVSAGRRSRSPDLRFSGRRSCVEREWVGSQDGAKIGIATGGEIVHCIVSPPMIEPFERGPG